MRPAFATTVAVVTAVMAVTPAFASGRATGSPLMATRFHTTPSRYGRYPAYTYAPDSRLRGMLRSDFNRGVGFPGR